MSNPKIEDSSIKPLVKVQYLSLTVGVMQDDFYEKNIFLVIIIAYLI
jgi:hypothetical protein